MREAPLKSRAVVEQLREHIVGTLAPGSQLPTFSQMEQSFGVSRGVLREAVSRLKHDGFIHAVDRRGLFVSDCPPHLGRWALVFAQNPATAGWPRFFTALQQQAAGIQERREDIRFASYCNVSPDPRSATFDELCRDVGAHRLAGLLLMPGTHELGQTEPLASAPVPKLFICGDPAAGRTPSITVDTPCMCARMTNWLRDRGRTRLAAVGMWGSSSALLAGLRERGDLHRPHWGVTVARENAADVETLAALLMDYPPDTRPDGLMILDDNLTEHAVGGLIQCGVRIGQDIDVIAHCNWPWPIPCLAPVQRIGFHARQLLEYALHTAEEIRQGLPAAGVAIKLPPVFEDEREAGRWSHANMKMPGQLFRLSLGFAVLVTWAPALPAIAADDTLTADVEVFYPVPQVQGRGGGVAAMGNGFMERLDAGMLGSPGPMLRLVGTRAPIQGLWWFPQHLPVTAEVAHVGDADARIVLDVDAAVPTWAEVSAQWRVEGELGAVAKSEGIEVGRGGRPTRVALPVPGLAPGAGITGILIGFSTPGDYRVRRLALGRLSRVVVDTIDPMALQLATAAKVTGAAAAGAARITVRFQPEQDDAPAVAKDVVAHGGRFELTVTQQDLTPGRAFRVSAEPAGSPQEASPPQRLFAYPALTGARCPPVTRVGRDLVREGRRFGFVGVNYTRFYLGLSIRADYETIARDLLQMRDWGVRVVRVPIDFGMVQPELGVMPDNPRYAEAMRRHGLDPAFVEQFDYFVALAGELGIYTVIDWHSMALDPYRYFLGGKEQDRKSGKPGTAIAYLAPSPTERGEFDPAQPRHLEALLNAHRWAARHLRANPNVLGIEIPFNEPHTPYMAIEANWRRVVDAAAAAVAEGDPNRLTFALAPSFSHNNLMPSVTWLPPDRAAGAGPHFYQANGPVPLRPDAKSMPEFWLARETEGTFGWGFPAMLLPLSAADYPFYNGECGSHGARMVLPDRPPAEAASLLVEAQLVQEYAAGMAGHLEWTLWGDPNAFVPFTDVYATLFRRFVPVFEAGPLERSAAKVAFVQHPEAVPSGNGLNYACIPFAQAALDTHFAPVHYLTDDQLLHLASSELSEGLEQVVKTAAALSYQAIVADRRHLDPRAVAILGQMGDRVLWLDRAEDLTAASLAAFMARSGVDADLQTPREIQWIEGPSHLVVYRRLDGGRNPARIHPRLNRVGALALIDEAGTTVFKGTAAQLAAQGLTVDLPLWRSAIYRFGVE